VQRIQPIGYDAKSNAYWFIGGKLFNHCEGFISLNSNICTADRLWVQREPYKPGTLKRKRAPATAPARKPAPNRGRKAAGKRRKVESDPDDSDSDDPISEPPPAKGRAGTRAAKTKANKQLDVQAKALAEFQRQNLSENSRAAKRQQTDDDEAEFSTPRKSVGTRLSKRLRGAAEEDEWQQIPEEWLDGETQPAKAEKKNTTKTPDRKPPPKVSKLRTGLESDAGSISDLTDLSSDSDEEAKENGVEVEDADAEGEDDSQEDDESVKEEEPEPEEPQEDPSTGEFVEWEMVCSHTSTVELTNKLHHSRFVQPSENGST
jgi:hypothetical protein